MAEGKVLKWLQRRWDSFIDPEQQERVTQLATYLRQRIAKEKTSFSLQAAIDGNGFAPEDVELARLAVYRKYVERALEDATLTESEHKSLDWVAAAFQLTATERLNVNREVGRDTFERALAHAIDDGHIDEAESAQIRSLAHFMGESVSDVMSDYFRKEGEHFLSSVFLSATEDGRLLKAEWSNFLVSAQRLGIAKTDAVGLIRPHAQRFVERALADAKSDGQITESEEANLQWLMTELAIPQKFRDYAENEIRELQLIAQIRVGRLPSITEPIAVELRAGEIVHFCAPVRFERIKQTRSGSTREAYDGNLAITDSRLVYDSPLRPFALNLRSVISLARDGSRVYVTANAKATGFYNFGYRANVAAMILAVAVGKANQTIVDSAAGAPSRHISREVRQRVWQRYSGRCVDCGATDYLEFDHIIPVAKGGSNDENNVQVLCRRCNLSKSDNI